jgi:uncharacterized protein YxjI
MGTRREFVRSLPAVGTAFAVGGRLVLDDSPAHVLKQLASTIVEFDPRFEIMPGTKGAVAFPVAQEDPYEADVGRTIAE